VVTLIASTSLSLPPPNPKQALKTKMAVLRSLKFFCQYAQQCSSTHSIRIDLAFTDLF